jgi:hypothetical protein
VIRCYGADPGESLSQPHPQWIFLISGNPQAVPGGVPETRRRARPGTPARVSGRPSYRQLARRFASDGEAMDGQVGGRSGDEGPRTVVLRDIRRGTEAARWRVNLKTGYRVQPM